MKKVGVALFVFVILLSFAICESTNNENTVNNNGVSASAAASVNGTNVRDTLRAEARERQEVRAEVREEVRALRAEYRMQIEDLRNMYQDDQEGLRMEIENLLESINSTNLTDEEKEGLRADLRGLVAQRVENRQEYRDEAKGIRVQYGDSLKQYVNEARQRYMMQNGREVEVKIMPEVASEKAIERLRLRNCNESNNCSIELKEVGEGEGARLAYSLRARKSGRFLGLFKTEMDVETEVDAETGDFIRAKKPWWAFLVNE